MEKLVIFNGLCLEEDIKLIYYLQVSTNYSTDCLLSLKLSWATF